MLFDVDLTDNARRALYNARTACGLRGSWCSLAPETLRPRSPRGAPRRARGILRRGAICEGSQRRTSVKEVFKGKINTLGSESYESNLT